jgi:hypothetical protein
VVTVPEPLIDDFDNDNSYASAPGQRDAMWWVSDPTAFWLDTISGVQGNSKTCLRVIYQKAAGGEWSFISAGGLMEAGKNHDFSNNHAISMRVCGNVSLMLKFEDADGRKSGNTEELTANSPDAWTTLAFPVGEWRQCDKSRIKNILIFVQPGATGEGTFYLDDLTAN